MLYRIFDNKFCELVKINTYFVECLCEYFIFELILPLWIFDIVLYIIISKKSISMTFNDNFEYSTSTELKFVIYIYIYKRNLFYKFHQLYQRIVKRFSFIVRFHRDWNSYAIKFNKSFLSIRSLFLKIFSIFFASSFQFQFSCLKYSSMAQNL